MVFKREDLLAGGLCVLLGAGFALYALFTLNIGTPSRMGSGFFPVMLGVLLAVLGLAIGLRSFASPHTEAVVGDEDAPGPVPWRAIVTIALAPILFAVTVRELGLALATAICVGVVCFASPRMTVRMGIGVTVGLTILCVAVFSFGLHLPLPLLPTFITG
ncbi:tripartite tricarboxylate transporter TctB family protein [Pelagibacterium nitratireducens]|uniref:Tripartite tricarboxylate transporter TctB family protein n=1 Tax=Pelagibacterium nitratireducens TaxID=1046114 RepID=A0ABZ2I091_9HYPH